MSVITISGDNRFVECTKFREACRGIIIQDGKILMTYARKVDFWMIPGGGLESEESLEQCCVRELAEETGLIVVPQYCQVTIDEFYEEWLYRSHYFICDIVDKTQRRLTLEETEAVLDSCWIPVTDALNIFADYQNPSHEEIKRGAYLREYSALSALRKEGLI